MLKKRLAGVLTASIIAGTATAPALAATVADLVKQGMYSKAYSQGLRELPGQEGKPEFDYAFGVAALETGNYPDAIFALERVVTLQPGNVDAHTALGRAFMAVNNHNAARNAFNSALQASPSGSQQSAIKEQLALLDRRAPDRGRDLHLWLEAMGGYDDNLNFGTSYDTDTFFFGGVPATPPNGFADDTKAQSGLFYQTRLGGTYTHRLDDMRSVDVLARIGKKQKPGNDHFDEGEIKLNVAYSVAHGGDQYRIIGRFEQDDVNDKRLRYLWGALGQYITMGKQSWNRGWQQTFVSGIAKIEYPKQRGRDVNQYMLGYEARKEVNSVAHALEAYYGYEDNDNFGLRFNGRQFFSVGWDFEYLNLTSRKDWFRYLPLVEDHLDRITPYGKLAYTYAIHNDDLDLFQETREDRIYDLTLGARWKISSDLSLFMEYQGRHADGNITIYDYNRNMVQAGFRMNLM